jgi:hypothetical protein
VTAGPTVFAGLDEAGLGPLLGPFCVGWCVINAPRGTQDLWDLLSEAVTRTPARGDARLVVDDSKRVHNGTALGRARLEATALAFLRASGSEARSLGDLERTPLEGLRPPMDLLEGQPWYAAARELPAHAEAADLEAQTRALQAALEGASARVREAAVLIVGEQELNASFARTQNKAASIWSWVGPTVTALFERYGEEHLHLTLDRQGGRRRYGALLAAELPFAEVVVRREDREEAHLEVREGPRRMTLVVRPRAEESSLPVAVGSCLAKQAREAAMEAFNAWFGRHQPDLVPTKGYVQDARRWLQDAGPALAAAGVQRAALERTR